MLIEDPRSGIARMNRWKLEEKGLTFIDVSPDPNHPGVQFARVQITESVCDLIKKQRGLVWINGGQATVQYNKKDLVPELPVNFVLQ